MMFSRDLFTWLLCAGNILVSGFVAYEKGGWHLVFLVFVAVVSAHWMGLSIEYNWPSPRRKP